MPGRPLSASRRPAGFTLVEMVIAVGLAAIVFTGLGSMFAMVFRSAQRALRKEVMQASENYMVKRMQRDFAAATLIWLPAVGGSSSDILEGFQNYVWNGTSYQAINTNAGAKVMHFIYRVCPATEDSSTYELYYWKFEDPSNTITKACTDKASGDPIVKYPLTLTNEPATDYFTRPNNNQILLQAVLSRPKRQGGDPDPLYVHVSTLFTAMVSEVRP